MTRRWLNQQQKHALASVASGLAASLLLIALVATLIFVSVKGSYYFWPMQAYKVSIEFSDGVSEAFNEYTLTASSQAELLTDLQEGFILRFQNSPIAAPQVRVKKEDTVYQISLKNGEVLLGKLLDVSAPQYQRADLSVVNQLQGAVDDYLTELKKIQVEHLAPLHEKIAKMQTDNVSIDAPARKKLEGAFLHWQAQAEQLQDKLSAYQLNFSDATGQVFSVYQSDISSLYQPNSMSLEEKIGYAWRQLGIFVSESPKQASTSGGVFPALFGTVLMVILMAIIVAPFGVLAAIYLHEYAPDNGLTTTIRIAVSNMAGVPSVVYGVFGLGFFVYILGGSIDALFFADSLPAPTFGAPGLLWASLTMALLTLPVVIVSTEEGLRRVPQGLRNGSYALGATKLETIMKTVVPIASPGMMTGIILAIARAAGEVAPLILVGAVKYAPNLPIDGEFPFVHLERQFMHLGVFIYDGAFYNQTNTQGSSLMFASCLLLLMVVFILNLSAIIVRKNLRKRYLQM